MADYESGSKNDRVYWLFFGHPEYTFRGMTFKNLSKAKQIAKDIADDPRAKVEEVIILKKLGKVRGTKNQPVPSGVARSIGR